MPATLHNAPPPVLPACRPQVDRRPPRPSKDSHVRIYRAPRYEAFASGFPGFPSPPRCAAGAQRPPLHQHELLRP